jgi:hypothetical protein
MVDKTIRMVERLGRRILGDVAVEKLTDDRRATGTERLGTRVTGAIKAVPAAGEGKPNADQNGDGYTTLAELTAGLAAHPEKLDRLIEVEMAGTNPRKGALRLFLATEAAKGDEARAEVVGRLTAALG